MELTGILVLNNMQINQTHIWNMQTKQLMRPFYCKVFLCTKSSTKK